jgi:hypothetical protein
MQSPTSPGFGFPEQVAPAEPAAIVVPGHIEVDIGQRHIHVLNRLLIAINLIMSSIGLGYIVITSTMLEFARDVFEGPMMPSHIGQSGLVTAVIDLFFSAIPLLTASLTLRWILTARNMTVLAGLTIVTFFLTPALPNNPKDFAHTLNVFLTVVCCVLACIKISKTFTLWLSIDSMDVALVVAVFTVILQLKKHIANEAKEPVNTEPKEPVNTDPEELVASGKHNKISATSENLSDNDNINKSKVFVLETVPSHRRKRQVASEIAPPVEAPTGDVTAIETPALEASAVEAVTVETCTTDALSTDALSANATPAETATVEAPTEDTASETKKKYSASVLVPPHMRKRDRLAVAVGTANDTQAVTVVTTNDTKATFSRAALVPPHLRRKAVASGVAPAVKAKNAEGANATAPGTTYQYKATAPAFLPTQARNKTSTATATKKQSPRDGARRLQPCTFHKKQATGPTPKPERRDRAVLGGWGDIQSYIKQDDTKVAAANAAKAEAMKDQEPGLWTVKYAERSTKTA